MEVVHGDQIHLIFLNQILSILLLFIVFEHQLVVLIRQNIIQLILKMLFLYNQILAIIGTSYFSEESYSASAMLYSIICL